MRSKNRRIGKRNGRGFDNSRWRRENVARKRKFKSSEIVWRRKKDFYGNIRRIWKGYEILWIRSRVVVSRYYWLNWRFVRNVVWISRKLRWIRRLFWRRIARRWRG